MQNIIDQLYSGTKIFPSKVRNPQVSLEDMLGLTVALYGLGECSHWFYEIAMRKFNLTPICALDQNPVSDTWCGLRALTAENFVTEFDIELTDCLSLIHI